MSRRKLQPWEEMSTFRDKDLKPKKKKNVQNRTERLE